MYNEQIGLCIHRQETYKMYGLSPLHLKLPPQAGAYKLYVLSLLQI